jgi:hypothetical protein
VEKLPAKFDSSHSGVQFSANNAGSFLFSPEENGGTIDNDLPAYPRQFGSTSFFCWECIGKSTAVANQ